jgi:hypothetical protein
VASLIWTTTVDCADPYALSVWWSGVLDFTEDPDDPNQPDHEECLIRSADGHHKVLFIRVPEAKSVKNRIHLDLRPTDRSRDEEVDRLVAYGATIADDRRQPDGMGWVVMTDPEGNEFCVLRSIAEYAATR